MLLLNGEWILKSKDGRMWKANVPGCVHTDIFEDYKTLFYRDNNRNAQWIENEDWIYERDFEIEKIQGAYITFEGLDTYCDIEINGSKVASCDNMFTEHTFFVEPFLKLGKNNIRVKFYSPIKKVEGKENLPAAFTNERVHTRRMQCTYGWDWVDRFVTCGIFRPVYITYKNDLYCKNVYVYTNQMDKFGAEVCVTANFENVDFKGVTVFQILDPDGIIIYNNSVFIDMEQYMFRVNIENPVLWDVLSDDNRMYVLRVSTAENIFEQKFGIRTLRILQKKDLPGSDAYELSKALQQTEGGKAFDKNTEFSSFEVILNGRSVMCKGANWVPCEPFPSEEKADRITKILEMSKMAGLNVVRVWGGGIFECQHFYDECDRLGIMVIQDFLMACGQYPEKEEWFIAELQKEADYATTKLRNHPSLIWWNGDNENATYGYDASEDYRGRNSALHGIFPVISKNDYSRTFLFSSPYGGTPYASKTVGTTHHTQYLGMLFDYIDSGDNGDGYLEYMKEYTARFISEEPCFGASSLETLSNFMTEEDIFENEDMWLYHTKGNPDLADEIYNYFKRFAIKLLGDFENAEDMMFKFQYLQYEWVRVSMENARRNRGYCNGIIYWMLDDCWPAAAGWSLIDYYLRPKAGLYAFKNYADDVIVSLDACDDKLWLYLCNDTNGKVIKDVSIKEFDISMGKVLNSTIVNLECDANTSNKKEIKYLSFNSNTVIVAEADGCRTWYKRGGAKLVKCKSPEVISCKDGVLTLKSDGYIHAVELYGGYVYKENFFSMLPDEVKNIAYSGDECDVKIKAYTFKII